MKLKCNGCGMNGADLLRCKRCKLGLYCSKECQSEHWADHRGVCRAFVASGIGHRFTIVDKGDQENQEEKGVAGEQRRAAKLNDQTKEANARFAARVLEFEQAAFPPLGEEPTRKEDEDEETFQARVRTFQENTVRLERNGWKDALDLTSGFLGGWFAQRYLRGLFTVYNQKYRDFQGLQESFGQKKIKLLSTWANLKMDNPPPNLDTPDKVERVLSALRNKQVTDISSPEARQREEIEHYINVEFRISQLMNEIAKVFNEGIRLNDLSNEKGALLNYAEERAATYRRLFTERPTSDKGKEEEVVPDDEQDDPAIIVALREKDDARRAWFQRIVDRLMPIGELIALGDTKVDIVQLIDTFMEDPLEFSGRHQNIALFGEPGTGKTEMGVKLGPLFYALGFVQVDPGETFNALSRADFIAGVLGQTVSKVRDVFLNNLGSFVFVDEAYAIHTDKEDSYGSEAVHEITNELQVYKGLISFAIAGYRDKIEDNLFAENPGLSSRFPEQWDFRTYSSPELYHIFSFLAARKGVNLGPGNDKRGAQKPGSEADPARVRQALINLIALMNGDEYKMFKDANGRAMETILSWTIRIVSQEKLRIERTGGADGRGTPRPGAASDGKGGIVTGTNVNDPAYLFEAFRKWAIVPKDQLLEDEKQQQFLEKVFYDLQDLQEGEEQEDWPIPEDLAKDVKSRFFKPLWPIPAPSAAVGPGRVARKGEDVDPKLLSDEHFEDLKDRFLSVRVIGDSGEGEVKAFNDNAFSDTELNELETDLKRRLPDIEKLQADMDATLKAYRRAIEQGRGPEGGVDEETLKKWEDRRKLLGKKRGSIDSVPYVKHSRQAVDMVGRTSGYLQEVKDFLNVLKRRLNRVRLDEDVERNPQKLGFRAPDSIKERKTAALMDPLLKTAKPYATALGLPEPPSKGKATVAFEWYKTFYAQLTLVLSFPSPTTIRNDPQDNDKVVRLLAQIVDSGIVRLDVNLKEPIGPTATFEERRVYYMAWYNAVVVPVLKIIGRLQPKKVEEQIGSIYFY